jgi:lactoylglutathione lyase
VQLALNVPDLDEAVAFYSALFHTGPAKVRPGYANFAIGEPALKLVLIEGMGEPGSINHLGVEVDTAAEVAIEAERLAAEGMATDVEANATCCYAVQDKVWVHGPDGTAWEIYTVLADDDGPGELAGDGACCSSALVDIAAPVVAGASPGCSGPACC